MNAKGLRVAVTAPSGSSLGKGKESGLGVRGGRRGGYLIIIGSRGAAAGRASAPRHCESRCCHLLSHHALILLVSPTPPLSLSHSLSLFFPPTCLRTPVAANRREDSRAGRGLARSPSKHASAASARFPTLWPVAAMTPP